MVTRSIVETNEKRASTVRNCPEAAFFRGLLFPVGVDVATGRVDLEREETVFVVDWLR